VKLWTCTWPGRSVQHGRPRRGALRWRWRGKRDPGSVEAEHLRLLEANLDESADEWRWEGE
jgi:hypothetical protein